jgi:4-aminobutyrate aminotransferase-like enzyme
VNHNDANDHNIIVSRDHFSPEVLGFIDFGDLHYGPRINDLAICLAYAIMRKPDPVGAAAEIIRGYHEVSPLLENELMYLLTLIKSRLVITITMAAIREREDPGNAYWQVSAADARTLLSKLCAYPAQLAMCRFRHACGMEPSPDAVLLKTWLAQQKGTFFPLTGMDLKAKDIEVFDLSVGSLVVGGFNQIENIEDLTWKVFKHLAAAGVKAGIGRYNEPRAVYTTPDYATPGNNGPEMRTIHIGIDIFLKPGSPLYAPLEGIVFAIVNDEGDKQYGPLVIIEHNPEPDLTFYTLYGHNSLNTLGLLYPGAPVERGQQIAFVGDYPENGNWVPHSHFQIITDMLGHTDDFPGVALASQREVWLSLCPDPNLILGIANPNLYVQTTSIEEMLQHRLNALGPNLSISHQRPLHVVRGWKSNLYAADATCFLDTRNNIAHVGHEHPRIVKAGQNQMAVLNTNTRYMHMLRLELADRLLESLPDNLTNIYFVNSGSEANDLALRMARYHTGSTETLVMDQAYHGATAACLEVSSYKFGDGGGAGSRGHIHVLPHLRSIDVTSTGQAIEFAKSVNPKNLPMTFIHETLPGCGGQIVPPEKYFTAIYDVIRQNGGICIADEVQTGMGRVGEAFWSFELFGVQADIVTIGKPLGNGHPVAAVAVSREIARSYDDGPEFFSSFGGNPVSCAIALEVLNVIRDEDLQSYAADTGKYWMQAIQKMAEDHSVIHEVRGFGLFFGIEFSLLTKQAGVSLVCDYIRNRFLDHHILTSFDGPHKNVMIIKPPLCIKNEEVDYFMEVLERVLGEDVVTRSYVQ